MSDFVLTRFSAARDVAISRHARVLAPAAWAASDGKDLAGVPPECQGGWRIDRAPTPPAESGPFLKPIARGLSAGSPPRKLGAAQTRYVASAASSTRAWIRGQQAALPCMERQEGAAGSKPNGRGMFAPDPQRPMTPPSRSRSSAASVNAFAAGRGGSAGPPDPDVLGCQQSLARRRGRTHRTLALQPFANPREITLHAVDFVGAIALVGDGRPGILAAEPPRQCPDQSVARCRAKG